jgi:predicted O-linked N-acetylglucosamine transferase (SPINDLY family)
MPIHQVTEHKGTYELLNCKKSSNEIVFCNFNQSVKIEYDLFKVWMNILKNVKNSVLWLLHSGATVNIQREAKKLGINPSRLLFFYPIEKKAHLERMRQADLLLDTTIYNAHTSAGDALWAGLPIITILGDTMPSRVCASMLKAAELSELIVNSMEEYEEKAIYFGNNIEELQNLKKLVESKREIAKLFNTYDYVKDFEKGLKCTWTAFIEGNELENIIISEL